MNVAVGRTKGIAMVLIGAMLWGATGPLMEWILSTTELSVSFMLTLRLIFAGILILVFLLLQKKELLAVWRFPIWRRKLIVFGVAGMLGVQFTFTAAIEASNAVVATLLQFLAPIFVVIYVSLSLRKWPPRYQVLGIVGTLIGLVLLLTNASFDTLLVSNKALLWGIGVGLTFAFYTLYPTALMKEWGVLVVVGWAMLIGGVVLGVISRIWTSKEWSLLLDWKVSLSITAVIFFGTIAFVLFLGSMKYISPVETSILSSMEPLTAMMISAIWFGHLLGVWQLVGVLLMIIFVTWLSIAGAKQQTISKKQSI